MASRPVFIPGDSVDSLVREVTVEFDWFPGFAASQKQKSIASLHRAAQSDIGCESLLEISSKSLDRVGTQLSAFQLVVGGFAEHDVPVENAFQGSKAFDRGGPYTDLYAVAPIEAKRDPRLKDSGELRRFTPPSGTWPLLPPTAFYDWVYIRALTDRSDLLAKARGYAGFTDIEFNPQKSINCQARSCALAVALVRHNLLAVAMEDQESFIGTCYPKTPLQQAMELE